MSLSLPYLMLRKLPPALGLRVHFDHCRGQELVYSIKPSQCFADICKVVHNDKVNHREFNELDYQLVSAIVFVCVYIMP
jgi:hypothetical protein